LGNGLVAQPDIGIANLLNAIALRWHDRAGNFFAVRLEILPGKNYGNRDCNERECGDPNLAFAGIIAGHGNAPKKIFDARQICGFGAPRSIEGDHTPDARLASP
jgi:hypothetical protein